VPADQVEQGATTLRVLILGGTTEARQLAAACAGQRGVETVSSLSGAVRAPRVPLGELRTGGFGGVDGLAGYLRAERIDAVVDATHPFATAITASAVEATAATGLPLVVLRRPGWSAHPGDAWHRVPSLEVAAALLPGLGKRIFLTTGRRSVDAFAGVPGCWFLARSVEPPEPVPGNVTVLLDRGPFTVDGERELLATHRIDVLVTKDSGGAAAKLTAARELGIVVVMVDRPPAPMNARVVASVAAVQLWLTDLGAGAAGTCP
jgi:precorrin-6A/cobalt-precorrin-6A reductase